jgi:hypothetical protein
MSDDRNPLHSPPLHSKTEKPSEVLAPVCENSRTRTLTRRGNRNHKRRLYAWLEPTPLTEEELRNLPAAHQYSA